MNFHLGEGIVMEFYSSFITRGAKIEIYPLKPGVTPIDLAQSLLQRGYNVSEATRDNYPNLFDNGLFFQEQVLDTSQDQETILLVSRDERMRGVVRHRQYSGEIGMKIESDDTEIKDSLESHLSD